jgi:hypothetical protein
VVSNATCISVAYQTWWSSSSCCRRTGQNSPDNPKPGRHALIIRRSVEGELGVKLFTSVGAEQILQTDRTFVTMTGGGHSFAPVTTALTVLAAP